MLVAAGNGAKQSEEEEDDDDETTSGKTRHGRRLGKYKYKEEVIKRVEFNHPCRSAIKFFSSSRERVGLSKSHKAVIFTVTDICGLLFILC